MTTVTAFGAESPEYPPGFLSLGYGLLLETFRGAALQHLRTEADQLVLRFTEGGFRSEDYWHFTRAGTHSPVLYRIHNLERQGAPALAALHAEGSPLHFLAEPEFRRTLRGLGRESVG